MDKPVVKRKSALSPPIHSVNPHFDHLWKLALILIVLAVLLGVTSRSTRADDNWYSNWPSGQPSDEVAALAVAPSNDRVIYAGTKAALYRSDSAGDSWTVVSSQPNLVALAIHPTNPDILYAYFWPEDERVTPEPKGFRKSTDGGKTWTDPSAGKLLTVVGKVSVLAIDPSNPANILAGADFDIMKGYGKVLRSTDGGITWNTTFQVHSDFTTGGMSDIVFHQKSPGIVYAAYSVYHGGGTIRSDDGGITWRSLKYIPDPARLTWPDKLAVDPNDPNLVYIANQSPMGTGIKVFRSTDGGSNWQETATGLLKNFGWAPHLVIDPLNPRTLFLSIQTGPSVSTASVASTKPLTGATPGPR